MKLSNEIIEIQESFINYGIKMGYKRDSYEDYIVKINEYLEWLDKDQLEIKDITNIQLGTMQDYLFYLKDGLGHTQSTISKKRVAIVNFYTHLQRNGLVKYNLFRDTKVPKVKKSEKKEKINYNEAMAIYEDVKKNESLRNIAVISMFVHQGLRENEISSYKIQNFIKYKDNDEIYVEAPKNDGNRVVSLRKQCKKDIEKYIESALYLGEKGFMFPSNKSKSGHISNQIIKTILNKSSNRIGLNKNVTPHQFRTALAMKMIELGLDENEIAYTLGHSVEVSKRHYRDYQANKINDNIKEKFE